MTPHTRFHFIDVALVLAFVLIALFAILLAALLLFLLTYMGSAKTWLSGDQTMEK
jgi:hypothetical protein